MCRSVLYRYIKLPNCFQYGANTCSIQSSNLSLMGKWRRGEQCFFSPIKHCVGKIFLFEKTVWVGFSRDRLVSCPVRHPIMNMLLLSCGRNSYRGTAEMISECIFVWSQIACMHSSSNWQSELFWDHHGHNDWFDVFIAGWILLAIIKISRFGQRGTVCLH